MSALDPRDIERFGKILGLLSSNHDGERAAAAWKASQFLETRQLGWGDVTEMLKAPPVIIRPQVINPSPADAPRVHQMDARRCLSSTIRWKEHESRFLHQMAAQQRKPTEKQRDWLDALSDRVTRFYRENACDF